MPPSDRKGQFSQEEDYPPNVSEEKKRSNNKTNAGKGKKIKLSKGLGRIKNLQVKARAYHCVCDA